MGPVTTVIRSFSCQEEAASRWDRFWIADPPGMRILAISVLILGLDWFGRVCRDNVIAGFASRASAATRGVVIAMGGGSGTPGQVTFMMQPLNQVFTSVALVS